MNDEMLIELVRQNPELYHLESKKYSDAYHKEKVWISIAKELNTTGTICKNRWNQLRDQWRKQKKKNITTSGQAAKPSKPWRYDQEMNFLEPFVRLRDTIGNLGNETAVNEDENTANDDDSAHLSDSDAVMTSARNSGPQKECGVVNEAATVQANTPSSSSGKRTRLLKNKKDQGTASSTLMQYLIKKQETESSVLATSTPQDATDAFFVGIIAKVKKFSPYYRNMLESKIFNFVQEIELQQIMQEQQSQQQQQHITHTLTMQHDIPSQQSTHQKTSGYSRYPFAISSSNPTSPFSSTPSPQTPQSAGTYLETFSYDESSLN